MNKQTKNDSRQGSIRRVVGNENVQRGCVERRYCQKILRESMETAVKLSVPLTVGVASGKSWYEA